MSKRWAIVGGVAMALVVSSTSATNAQTEAQPHGAASAISASRPSSSEQPSSERKSNGSPDPATSIINPPPDVRFQNTVGRAPANFLLDERAIWTSPVHVRLSDATWLVPLGGFAAGLFATDSEVSRHLNPAPGTMHRYKQISNYGVGAMVGAGAGLYMLGLMKHEEHARETGFLAGEAAVDSLLAAESVKYMTRRERPYADNADGRFWRGGDSFPSEHATAAWSIAGVIAHEYP